MQTTLNCAGEQNRTYTNEHGEVVGTIRLTPRGWLVEASDAYMHGSSTMWWASLKAAEYHLHAIAEEPR